MPSRSTVRPGPTRWTMIGDALSRPLASWYLVLVSSLLLVGLGGLMVLSSSSVYSQAVNKGDPYYFFKRQLVFLAVGLPIGWWLSRQQERRLKMLGWVAYIGSLLLLLAIFVPGLGSDAGKGNLAWLDFGFIAVQPSEFAKLGLVMWSASLVSTKQKVLDRPRELLPLLGGFLLVEILVLAQKDLGTGLVVGAIIFSILFVIGIPVRMLGAMLGVALVAVLGLVVTSPNRMTRIAAFITGDAINDPNASQQPMAALYALASGGWWGRGLGGSRQKWGGLNDGAQNDFVFAVIGEELGLLGTLMVLFLFAVLGYAGFRIAMRADRIHVRVLAAGITSWIMFQALVNIGVAMKMLPVVGVPLPFISYGGSALMANVLAVSILLACARQEPAARKALARKAGEPRPKVTTVVDGGR